MENVFGVVNNPVEPSVSDINKELLNELETKMAELKSHFVELSQASDVELTQKLKSFSGSLEGFVKDASDAATKKERRTGAQSGASRSRRTTEAYPNQTAESFAGKHPREYDFSQ
ncbi:unnamed protein product [Nippostrongylus brasiliensis]|uniref:Gag-protease polyprotein n=1 Tax=Nippostrongylus brasiliensis TaxID=27835 RepID=A0A0N4XWH4_NIPBR|nr:unnamed protein product [Nippostrongylus brasiliensis]